MTLITLIILAIWLMQPLAISHVIKWRLYGATSPLADCTAQAGATLEACAAAASAAAAGAPIEIVEDKILA
jgi:hypothetical protein